MQNSDGEFLCGKRALDIVVSDLPVLTSRQCSPSVAEMIVMVEMSTEKDTNGEYVILYHLSTGI